MLPVFLIGFSVSSHAAIYNWFPHFNMELTKEGDGTSFSDPLNWATAEQADPSQPPGAGDTASLSSGATVTAGGVSVSKLNGLGTATLTLNGSFSAQSVAGGE